MTIPSKELNGLSNQKKDGPKTCKPKQYFSQLIETASCRNGIAQNQDTQGFHLCKPNN